MDNRQIATLISERIGPRPVPFEAVRTLALEIYHDLGGREDDENFADIFEILLSILPLTNLIDDTSIYLDKTWSSYKIDASLNQVITGVEELMNFDCSTIEPTTTNFVPGTEYTIHEALQRTANLFSGYQDEIDDINALIPGQATESNQLADKSFVNSTVATNAANFRGNWTNWSAVPTEASLYPEDYVGNRTPTNNDYMMVQDTSDYDGFEGSWRFIYVGDWNTSGKSGWNPQYKVGSTFTAAQQDAIDSGITATKVATYDGYGTSITALQTDKLDKVYTGLKIYGTDTLGGQIGYEAGTGISFENGKISNTNTEAAWGNITGTLSDQTDLSTALDSKQDMLTAGNNITINGTTISANDTTYSASDNIDITNNAIKAVGYRYDTTNGAFAEGDRDIVKDGTTYLKSTATGIMSHAEGTDSSASGEYSHAEGYQTIASSTAAHAEGTFAWALANGAHAEGGETTAEGEYSHAEGYQTYASGIASHAEGKGKTAAFSSVKTVSTEGSNHLYELGSLTTTISNKSYTLQVGNTVNFGLNYAKVTAIDTSTQTITTDKDLEAKAGYTINLIIGGSFGDSAHSEGYLTTAFGDYSHAEGYQTIASGAASHAGGYIVLGGSINADGDGSFAHGHTTNGSISATGKGAVAIGWAGGIGDSKGIIKASGGGAHAEGYANRGIIDASGNGAHAEGCNTAALAKGAHAEGIATKALADGAHTEGRYTSASGTASHAEGNYTIASGNYSHAEGGNTTASGNYSHAEGYYTNAIGVYSHAEGYETTASGTASHAEGYYTNAIGVYSHAEGYWTTASGDYSHAEGGYADAVGDYSHAEGFHTEANNQNEHASGKYNKSNNQDANAQTIFSIGIGTSKTDRKNAIEVLRDGRVYITGIGGYDGTNPFDSSSLQDFLSGLSGGGNA